MYAVDCHNSASQLHCQVAIPGASIQLTPLYAKKVCQVPLSQSLQADLQQAAAKRPQNGLLSMDQARSLLPLTADDPNVSLYDVPVHVSVQHSAAYVIFISDMAAFSERFLSSVGCYLLQCSD